MLRRVCLVQIQPGTPVPDHVARTARTRQRDLEQ